MTHTPDAPFDEPWQARTFALAQALLQTVDDREEFRRQLIAVIAADGGCPYWDSFLTALERFMTDRRLVAAADLPRAPGAPPTAR